ncbi:hypothetical protein [Streptosporangium canum]|uniref:hypothetical protein n=1 Tax=Streptosporangium canum TaxID=324952 RepID=UPI00378A39EF
MKWPHLYDANPNIEAADDRRLTKTINRYGRVDLLCIDELGSNRARGGRTAEEDRVKGGM